jgi:hypothetical protein
MLSSTHGITSRSLTRPRALVPAVLTLGLTLSLVACGGDKKSTRDEVASVVGNTSASASASASGTSSQSDTAAKRPQIRLDTGNVEAKKLYRVWFKCLIDHGQRTQNNYVPDWDDHSAKAKAAAGACANKQPLGPPELDRDKNSDYLEQFHAYVQCLKRRGAKIVELANGEGWNYSGEPQTLSQSQLYKFDVECQKENFHIKKDR